MKYVNYDNLETAKEMIKVALDKKVDKEDGKGLSTNDYTNEEKLKLSRIEDEANKTIVDSELSLESTNPVENKIVSEELNTKANKIEVEEALETKADKATVEAELETKANKTEVEEALETKADKVTVEESLATKVDKESGKGLSTNDFTDEEKEKLSKLDEKSNENTIEVIKQNGQVLEIIDKSVNIVTITDSEIDDKIEEAVKNVDVDLTDYAKRTDMPKNVSDLFNDLAFISSSDEKDPTVPSHVKAITEEDIAKWNSGTGSDSGSCNVIVDALEPSNGEAIWIKLAKNLCHFNNVKNECSIKSNGSVSSDTYWDRWLVTDFIEIEPDTKYTLSGIKYGTSSRYHAWYDSNKNPISAFPRYIPTSQDRQTVTSPTNAKYIRFSIYNGNDVTEQDERLYFQFEKGSVATSYAPYSGKSDMFVKNSNGEYEQIYEAFPVPSPEIEEYVLPAATANTLGGIKVGNNLTVDADGTLHAQAGGGNDYDINDSVERHWLYNPTKVTPTKGSWSLLCESCTTDEIPAGKYLMIYKASLLAIENGMVTINASLDGVRLSNSSRSSFPLVEKLVSSGQISYYVEFEETKTHTVELYGYLNVDVTNTNNVEIEFIRIGDLVSGGSGGEPPSMLTASLPAHVEITATNTAQKITSFVELTKIGDKFSVENGVIKIGKGVSKIKLAYNAVAQATVSTTRTFTYIMLNEAAKSQESYYFSDKIYQVGNAIPSMLLDVKEGDEITLMLYGYKGNKILGATTFTYWTQITVEEVKETSLISGGGITEETDPTVPEHVKAITEEDIEKWNSGTGNISSDIVNSIMIVDALPEIEVEGILYLVKESEIIEPEEPTITNLWKNATIMHEYFFDTDKIILDYKDGVNYYSAYIPCDSNAQYKITRTMDGYRFRIANTSVTPAQGVSYSNYLNADSLKDIDYTTSSDAQYLVIYYVGSSETLDPTELFNDISITKVS